MGYLKEINLLIEKKAELIRRSNLISQEINAIEGQILKLISKENA